MKEEIKNIKVGSRSNVSGEANTGVGLGWDFRSTATLVNKIGRLLGSKNARVLGAESGFHAEQHPRDPRQPRKHGPERPREDNAAGSPDVSRLGTNKKRPVVVAKANCGESVVEARHICSS